MGEHPEPKVLLLTQLLNLMKIQSLISGQPQMALEVLMIWPSLNEETQCTLQKSLKIGQTQKFISMTSSTITMQEQMWVVLLSDFKRRRAATTNISCMT